MNHTTHHTLAESSSALEHPKTVSVHLGEDRVCLRSRHRAALRQTELSRLVDPIRPIRGNAVFVIRTHHTLDNLNTIVLHR